MFTHVPLVPPPCLELTSNDPGGKGNACKRTRNESHVNVSVVASTAKGVWARIDVSRCDPGLPRWTFLQQWLLGNKEPDHLGDVTMDRLVVGDAGAHSVRDGDISKAIGCHQPWNPEHRVGPECQRIQECIVNPAVDDVHATQATSGALVDVPVVDDQVWSL